MHGVAPYPLYWPLDRARTNYRRDAKFKVGFSTSREDLLRELALLGGRDVLISSNVPIRRDGLPMVPDSEPPDPGVAVYFTRKGKSYVIACDVFRKVQWNLRAIGETVGAIRSIERHGATGLLEQAFSGFAALPPATVLPRSWREVLGMLPGPVSGDAVRARFHELVSKHHPDVGGELKDMIEINAAYDQARRELGV